MYDLTGTDMDPSIEEHSLVIATNMSTRPLPPLLFHGRRYELKPGVPTNIPYLAMVLWFGNPKLRDLSPTDMDLRYRTNECDRLSAKWGMAPGEAWYSNPETDPTRPSSKSFYEGMDPTAEYIDVILAGRLLYKHPNLPNVVCMTYDQQRIITVIDDPEGTLSYPADAFSSRSEVEELTLTVEKMRQQMLMLIEQIGTTNPDAALNLAQHVPPRVGMDANPNTLPTFDAVTGSSITPPHIPVPHDSINLTGVDPNNVAAVMAAMQQTGAVIDEAAALAEIDFPVPAPVTPAPSTPLDLGVAMPVIPDAPAVPKKVVAKKAAATNAERGLSSSVASDPVPTKRASVHKPAGGS